MINNVKDLLQAINVAKTGDTLVVAPGNYSLPYIQKILPGITIMSDPKNAAFFPDLTVFNGGGITFKFIKTVRARVQNGHNVHFDTVVFTGDINKDDGLHIQGGCNDVSVKDSEFTGLFHGLTVGNSTNVSLIGNTFHNIRADGIAWSTMHGLTISKNTFYDWHPVLTGTPDHPDAIQGTPAGSQDVTISWNLVDGGNNATKPMVSQGIGAFSKGTVSNYIQENNFIRNLLFSQGMLIDGATSGSVSHNIVLGTNVNRTIIDMAGTINKVSMTGNTVTHLPANIPKTGYTMIPLPPDGGDALLTAWKLTV